MRIRLLAIDLGTSAIKLMRLDETGRVLASDRIPVAGIDVDSWMDAIAGNIRAHGDGDGITAMAVTGQMHGLVTRTVDASPGVAIPWHDARSADLLPSLNETLGADAKEITGGPIAAGFLAASLAWVRQEEPAHWSRIGAVSPPKDALVHALTGEHVTDPTDAAGSGLLDIAQGSWSWPVVDALGIPREWLPRIIPSGSIAGTLTPLAGRRIGIPDGIPVVVAGGDAPVGAVGAGLQREGDALVMLSTGAQVLLPASACVPDPAGRWYTWPSALPAGADHAAFLKAGTLMNAGNVLRWADDVLPDRGFGEGPSGLLALPHLIGTRADPDLRGVIVGIGSSTTGGEIRRAMIEGVGFSLRSALDEMTGSAELPERVFVGGGLANAPAHVQILADVLGVSLNPVMQPDVTVFGAGLLALHALGVAPSVAASTGEPIVPIVEHAATYDALYGLYRELDETVGPIGARLASLRIDPLP